MRVAVTGATGFVGLTLCRRLVAAGHQVTALHRPSSQVAPLQAIGATLRTANLASLTELQSLFTGLDAVVHAAANIRYASAYAAEHQQVNVEATRQVATACRLSGVGRLVHVSSVAAIGIPDDQTPATEEFPFNLQHAGLSYHLSKKRAEEAVSEQVAAGLNAVIVNPASIFGPAERTFRGGEMIRKVAGGPVVPYFGGGLSAVHVDDVVSGILGALEHGRAGQRYILGGDNISFREIARQALQAQGLQKPLILVPAAVTGLLAAVSGPVERWTGRPARFGPELHYCSSRFQYYSSERARTELSYRPRPFAEIIQAALRR